jgi:hypothetical protein
MKKKGLELREEVMDLIKSSQIKGIQLYLEHVASHLILFSKEIVKICPNPIWSSTSFNVKQYFWGD